MKISLLVSFWDHGDTEKEEEASQDTGKDRDRGRHEVWTMALISLKKDYSSLHFLVFKKMPLLENFHVYDSCYVARLTTTNTPLRSMRVVPWESSSFSFPYQKQLGWIKAEFKPTSSLMTQQWSAISLFSVSSICPSHIIYSGDIILCSSLYRYIRYLLTARVHAP